MTTTLSQILAACPSLSPLSPPRQQIIGRDKELQELLLSSYKVRRKNVLLLGPSGVGKTSLVKAFSTLTKSPILSLSVGQTIAGTKYRGDYEDRVEQALSLIKAYNLSHHHPIILFIDEFHDINAGRWEGSLSLGDLLKPIIDSPDIQIIGATIKDSSGIFDDKALIRRFNIINVSPLKRSDMLKVLNDFAKSVNLDVQVEKILESSDENLDTALDKLDILQAKMKCQKEL